MSRPLRIGLQLPEAEREVGFAELVRMAEAAEGIGVDSLWLGDHLLYRDGGGDERGPHEVWTLLAALAARTERVTLGPLVACLAFHPPAVLAKMAATIAEIAGGRLVLGVGSGWNEAEFRAFGLPFDHRVSRFEEAFEIVRLLVAGERATLDGRFWQAQDAVLVPAPRHRIPLLAGVSGPRALQITLPHVDAWNTWFSGYGNTVEGFAARNAEIDEAVRRAGRELGEVERSACVLVAAGGRYERPHDAPPVDGAPGPLAAHLEGLAGAGADEAILVLDRCDETTVRALEPALRRLDR